MQRVRRLLPFKGIPGYWIFSLDEHSTLEGNCVLATDLSEFLGRYHHIFDRMAYVTMI